MSTQTVRRRSDPPCPGAVMGPDGLWHWNGFVVITRDTRGAYARATRHLQAEWKRQSEAREREVSTPAPITAREARDAAMEQAEGGASVLFNHAADEAIARCAREFAEFTTDEVERYCTITPEEPRAFGPAMMRAFKAGIIERTDRTRQSESKVCHAREKRVWKSLIYAHPMTLFEDVNTLQNTFGTI